MFRVNEVITYNGLMHRILSLYGEQVVWIRLDEKAALPSLVLVRELMEAIEEGALVRTEDPFAELAYITPEQGSAAQVKRDRNYVLIKAIVEDPEYFDPKVRAGLIKEVIDKEGTIKKTLYSRMRRYWQRGQTPNALLPDYKNSGAKGQKKKAASKKLGRPRKYTPGVGVAVDEQIERLFRIAIDKYLLKDTGCSFPYAHRRFKDLYKNYFPAIPEPEIPTKWQLQYFYKREYGLVERLQKRTSKIEYNKDKRPLIGTANSNVLGPGSRFEIDATIADIYLVSDSDRRNIVGRPVIYMVIDVFSRMVAGLYVGFESPSYAAAIQALAVAMTDKVEWCKR